MSLDVPGAPDSDAEGWDSPGWAGQHPLAQVCLYVDLPATETAPQSTNRTKMSSLTHYQGRVPHTLQSKKAPGSFLKHGGP